MGLICPASARCHSNGAALANPPQRPNGGAQLATSAPTPALDPRLLDTPRYRITRSGSLEPTIRPDEYFPEAPLGDSLQHLPYGKLFMQLPLGEPREFSREEVLYALDGLYLTLRGALDSFRSAYPDDSKSEQRDYARKVMDSGRMAIEWLYAQKNIDIEAKVRGEWVSHDSLVRGEAAETEATEASTTADGAKKKGRGGRKPLVTLRPEQRTLAQRARRLRKDGVKWEEVESLCGKHDRKTLVRWMALLKDEEEMGTN